MTTACGCNDLHPDETYAQVDVEDDVALDAMIDPRGTTLTRWSGLIAPYDTETGDGRRFAGQGSLSNRDLPVPLRWHRQDDGGHKQVVVVGTVDKIEYRPDGAYASGVLFNPDPAQLPRLAEDVGEARLLLEKKAVGPSVDLDDMEYAVREPAPEGDPSGRPKIDVTKGRISGVTLVQIPAFAETRGIELGEVDAESYAAAQAVLTAAAAGFEEVVSVPGWQPSRALRFSEGDLFGMFAQTFAFTTDDGEHYYPIRDYVDGRFVVVREAVEYALRALDFGPPPGVSDEEARDLRERFSALLNVPTETEGEESMVASAAPVAPPAAWFANPQLDGPTPLTVTPEGQVYGHLATWRTCHTGFAGTCVTAPRSAAQYAYFHTGEVLTAEGEPVAVGRVTLGGGHADTRLGFQAAIEHYDNAGTCAALARAGEDKFGIWLAGALVPEADEATAAALRRHPPSGDWRRVGGNLELVGALAVNTPGFPVPRARVASGAPMALVAAGALMPEEYEDEVDVEDLLERAVSTALERDRAEHQRSVLAASAFQAADRTAETARRDAREAAAAGVFGKMPDFIKKKIKARGDAENPAEDAGEDEGTETKKKGKPFGGKKALPFGKRGTYTLVSVGTGGSVGTLEYEVEEFAADLGAGERERLAGKGKAMPGGSFPIPDESHLRAAIKAVGRAKGDHDAVRRFIIGRAAKLHLEKLIPDNWASDGSVKD